MPFLLHCLDFFLHLDKHMLSLVAQYGTWTYLILFLIIFCETGLVVVPFLPGDSLLFVAGALSATSSLELSWIIGLLVLAAISGNMLNYAIGRMLAPRIFRKEHIRFLKPDHMERTHQFFEKYGGKAIIITRFVPIVRSFAPFLAGVGSMDYRKFIFYNIAGALLWVVPFSLAGYFFGNIPAVKHRFSLVVIAIVFVSVLPIIWEYFKEKKKKSAAVDRPKS